MTLVHAKDLICSYDQNPENKVLYIRDLTIERGRIVFLLGASGSGKSTFLETLGLMNNTLCGGDIELDRGDRTFSYAELWKEPGKGTLNDVRRKNLSFIFQNTNLMENFTAYENICLSRMIKEGSDQEKAMAGAGELMTQVGLPPSEVAVSTLPVNLSGGQRQRVSFARALNTDFSLLLCDEPTGNLDESNARELMRIIRANIGEDRSAIIVSHDVDLALQFADQIVVISKDPEKGFGEVHPENNFRRVSWEALTPDELLRFRQRIVGFFTNAKERMPVRDSDNRDHTHKNYKSLFIQKESRILFGRNNINLMMVSVIVMLTLLAAGFANGSLEYLEKKYNDPFINWITIRLPGFRNSSDDISFYREKLEEEDTKRRFYIQKTDAYKAFFLPFFSQSKDEDYWRGRYISSDDPLLGDLCNSANLVRGESFLRPDDYSIILTEKMLNSLVTWGDKSFVFLNYGVEDPLSSGSDQLKVPVAVRAVVKSLPGKMDFLVTKSFFKSYMKKDGSAFDHRQQRWKICLFTGNDADRAEKLLAQIKPLLNKDGRDTLEIYTEIGDAGEFDLPDQLVVKVQFDPQPDDFLVTEKLFNEIRQLPAFDNEKVIRIFYYGDAEETDEEIYDSHLSINLSEGGLDQVDSLSSFIRTEFNPDDDEINSIEIDSGLIKEKKNFNYLGKITYFIAAMLILFAVMAISLFISNLLRSHLSRVKTNIGTYKAFGLSDKESTRIYLQIMLRFILICISAAFLLASGFGYLIELYFSNTLRMEDNIDYFQILDLYPLLLILVIIGISYVVSYYNINKILSKTPGDLIYNR